MTYLVVRYCTYYISGVIRMLYPYALITSVARSLKISYHHWMDGSLAYDFSQSDTIHSRDLRV